MLLFFMIHTPWRRADITLLIFLIAEAGAMPMLFAVDERHAYIIMLTLRHAFAAF